MSSSLITCECGAKIRLPENSAGRALRCPKCKKGLALTTDAVVLSTTVIEAGQEANCPICQSATQPGEECVTCPGCDQVHHRECWGEIGGCGTYGCPQAPANADSKEAAAKPLSAWGDTKKCPACGEVIKSIALKCRYCGTDFDSVDPLSVADLRRSVAADEKTVVLKRNVVILLIVSLIGCLAPIALPVALIYLLPKRAQLAKCGPIFVIMGWTSIVLSALYSLAILLVLLFQWMSDSW